MARFILLLFLGVGAFAQEISPKAYRKKVVEIASKVPEFQWLAQRAEHHGLKVWLFGGTASSFAHYVKDNMLMEKGVEEFYEESFAEHGGERDYTDIFRPTQDIDLVVDGDSRKIDLFEGEVLGKFPDMKGNKRLWEVRSLRGDRGEKLALLNNPHFFNQHTDSHSVGLIALNSKKKVVRDLLHWDSSEPRFLRNVLEGKLHYYHSSKHFSTSRFKRGLNPEIFSVVRYFTKMFQFELEPSPKDFKKIKSVIKNFSSGEITDGYVKNWFDKNVPKLFLHSKNVEYAWDILEEVGLREKLLQVGSEGVQGSPAWWANKEPLRSFSVGKGPGKTAEELGIKTLAHDTSDFFIWSVITRSRKGDANVFISRPGILGENAVHGEGFYTLKNSEQGMWKNGWSIKFDLDPLAREGSDFKMIDNMVLVLNKSAIRVIPESLQVYNLTSYFHLLDNMGQGSRVLLEKTKRKLAYKAFSRDDIGDTISFLQRQDKENLWKEWLYLDISRDYPNALKGSYWKDELLIFFAIEKKDMSRSKILFKAGADINVQNSYGESRLYDAVRYNKPGLFKTLLALGADVNMKNGAGLSPLSIAVSSQREAMVRDLLEAGAEVNTWGIQRWAPLHSAAMKGDVEIIRMLLKAGADTSIENGLGDTPLVVAKKHGHGKVVSILLEAGVKASCVKMLLSE